MLRFICSEFCILVSTGGLDLSHGWGICAMQTFRQCISGLGLLLLSLSRCRRGSLRLALESLGLIADSGCWLQLHAHRRNQVEFPVPNLGFSPVLLCSSRYMEFLSLSISRKFKYNTDFNVSSSSSWKLVSDLANELLLSGMGFGVAVKKLLVSCSVLFHFPPSQQ